MNWKRTHRPAPGEPGALPRLVLLALFFLGGVALGQVLALRVPEATGDELKRYLADYVRVGGSGGFSAGAALSALAVYFRYPLLAFLLGFASAGVVLLPCAAAAFGFFLSFSVCCFTAAFGADGVLLALAVFGLRCAVTLPVFFLLAVPAWGKSAGRARASFGRGLGPAPASCGSGRWLRLAACGGVLLAGVCADMVLSPWLLQLVLERLAA